LKVPDSIEGYLRYPFYTLYHTDDLLSFEGIQKEDVAAFLNRYEPDLREHIVDALKWVVENPEADLTDILPNLPCSNDGLHDFARRIYCLAANRDVGTE
jgi:hypothetical protein